MSRSFVTQPGLSICRAVINGDDAVSPSTPANVMFDAFGPKLHAETLSGLVDFSSFAASVSCAVPPGSGASAASFRGYQVNFPTTLDYVPTLFVVTKNSSGVWSRHYIDNQTFGTASYGIFFNNGTFGEAGGFATPSYLLLYWYVVSWPNDRAVTPPVQYSYRLFGV